MDTDKHRQIENMKCCGNCKHIFYAESQFCNVNELWEISGSGLCDEWEHDNLTRKQREAMLIATNN